MTVMHDRPAVDIARDLRPQTFGKARAAGIDDPLVEPMWPGLRVIAAVDGDAASMFDDQGEPVEDQVDLCIALAESLSGVGSGAILDGYLTKQVASDEGGVYTWINDYPTMAGQMNRMLVGGRRFRAEEMQKLREAERADVTFEPEDAVNLVVVDLLWLDGSWLTDVPLLERKRILESILPANELVRPSPYVRQPVGTWIGSWRAQGFRGLAFKAANSRYRPGEPTTDWATTPMPRR